MSGLYRRLIRPVLFSFDSEEIHSRTLRMLGWTGRRQILCDAVAMFCRAPELPVHVFGLTFPNPVGLAAGMDKCAEAVPVWEALGFGFAELGGVTWLPQPGNPAPRLFRAVADGALVNRMGFNNPGAEAVAGRLAELRASGGWPRHPVGINLGKSKDAPMERAAEDYAKSLRALWPHADFFVVNVSSPNTPNLRRLQDKAALDEVLAALQEVNSQRSISGAGPSTETDADPGPHAQESGAIRAPTSGKPILVKVAPDLSFEALDQILELAGPRRIAGVVATNTTLERPDTSDAELKRVYEESGGLSGRPVRARSTEMIRYIHRQTKGSLPIVGVGGIFNAEDAWEKITAGASLVQLYTGLIYEGPGVVSEIVNGLRERNTARGFASLKMAVGTSSKGA